VGNGRRKKVGRGALAPEEGGERGWEGAVSRPGEGRRGGGRAEAMGGE